MKSSNIAAFAQLLLAGTTMASLCKPTLSSASIGSAASYTPPASSSSAGDNNDGGGNSAATYYPPSGSSYSVPAFSPPAPPVLSSVSSATQPIISVSPCGQLVGNGEFALGGAAFHASENNGASLTFPGAAVCGGGPGGDGRTSCGQFALGTTDKNMAHVAVSQTISTNGAIVDGEQYQIYIQYRVVANTAVDTVTVNLVTVLDGSNEFDHDLTHESEGGGGSWTFLHYEHTAVGTSMDISVALTGSAGTAGAGFATTLQIGEINVVGCRSGVTSSVI